MRQWVRPIAAAAMLVAIGTGPGAAQEVRLPLLEAGIFGGGAWLPDYYYCVIKILHSLGLRSYVWGTTRMGVERVFLILSRRQ